MSETTFPFKKAIPIIAVTWILSLITTLAFVYIVIPNIFPPTWHEVAEFSGIFRELDDEDTDSFYISCDHWRIDWNVYSDDPPSEDVEFRLFVLGSSYSDCVWLTLADFPWSKGQEIWLCAKWGTEYVIGSGEFRLRIVGASLEWDIDVEAYY